MLKNEKGFTFMEGILSISLIVLVASSLFPLLFKMLSSVQDEKKELAAYRLLYEQAEKQLLLGQGGTGKEVWNGVEFIMTVKQDRNGRWQACVVYEKNERCVQ